MRQFTGAERFYIPFAAGNRIKGVIAETFMIAGNRIKGAIAEAFMIE
jgi:hypothetical protein